MDWQALANSGDVIVAVIGVLATLFLLWFLAPLLRQFVRTWFPTLERNTPSAGAIASNAVNAASGGAEGRIESSPQANKVDPIACYLVNEEEVLHLLKALKRNNEMMAEDLSLIRAYIQEQTVNKRTPATAPNTREEPSIPPPRTESFGQPEPRAGNPPTEAELVKWFNDVCAARGSISKRGWISAHLQPIHQTDIDYEVGHTSIEGSWLLGYRDTKSLTVIPGIVVAEQPSLLKNPGLPSELGDLFEWRAGDQIRLVAPALMEQHNGRWEVTRKGTVEGKPLGS